MKGTTLASAALGALGTALCLPVEGHPAGELKVRVAASIVCLFAALIVYFEGDSLFGGVGGHKVDISGVPVSLQDHVILDEEKKDTPEDLDAYENVYDVKKGGFSRVKLVRRAGTKETFAMKLTNIHRAFDEGQVGHTLSEKEVLAKVKHPFVNRLYATFRDDTYVYFLLEFVPGGELFDVIKRERKLCQDHAKFYAANVIAAVEYLHSQNVAFRDLKSENLLLDRRGYLKVIDFGMSRFVRQGCRCTTFAGTLDYVSPEILRQEPYEQNVDWWALGCLVHEMLTGSPPFVGSEEERLRQMVSHSLAEMDGPGIESRARDFVRSLLHPKLGKRLGTGVDAGYRIRCHPWFEGFDWIALVRRELEAPNLSAKGASKLNILTTPQKKLLTRSLSVRAAVENDPPESPRTYSPKAIDTFFKGF